MNSKQKRILYGIFADPVPGNIGWAAFEELLWGLGCVPLCGDGSRARFQRRMLVVTFQRSDAVVRRCQVRDARDFLIAAGVQP
jgi:hypothetical protein